MIRQRPNLLASLFLGAGAVLVGRASSLADPPESADAPRAQQRQATSLPQQDADASRQFWAFQPLRKRQPPGLKNERRPCGDIDRFILSRLEAAGLAPAAEANRETLVRRVYFDLIGLPPSIAEIDEFVNDDSPEAVAHVVDRLLDSPQFGERWGRHWLDVARYADSSGGGRSLLFPNAWRYRDYVIESFHRDKRFDQFIREQIAGDLMPGVRSQGSGVRGQESGIRSQGSGVSNEPASSLTPDPRPLIPASWPLTPASERLTATAFLMIGAHNYELQDKETLRMDVVDEQIEAVGRAFLGMTLGCARCHDHKFDPIPTTDYYALAGIFRSTKSLTPGNVSGFEQHELPVSPERRAELDAYAAKVKTAQEQFDLAKAELKKLQDVTKVAAKSAKPGDAREPLVGIVVDDTQARVVGAWTKSKFNPGYVGEGYIHDGASGKGEKSVTFPVDLPHDGEYEVRLSYTHGTNRSPAVPVTIRHGDDEETVQVDQRQEPPIDKRFITLGRWRFKKGASDAVFISNEGTTGHVIVDAVQFIPVEVIEKKAATEQPDQNQTQITQRDAEPIASLRSSAAEASALQEVEAKVKQLEADFKKLKDAAPEPPPTTMGVKDEKETADFRVCLRGDVHHLGQEVERGFLKVASTADASTPKIASNQSGRLELAEWLASPENPLTARVAVNRIWQHLFGVGLVRTADNFGATGETPSHPELLDWLALRFVELGWSHKKLIREIMLSRTYQLSSEAPSEIFSHRQSKIENLKSSDPDNRLLTHQNRRRLDAESLRDAILFVSGQLDLTRGGPAMREKTTSEYGYAFDSPRRSVYLPVFRNNLPDVFEVFDFADPNNVTGRRNVSTLPSQALFLMNSPFVMDQARRAAEAILEHDIPDADRIDLAYRRSLGRLPTSAERSLALRYVHEFRPSKSLDPTAQRLQAWTRLQHTLFASIDFRYVY